MEKNAKKVERGKFYHIRSIVNESGFKRGKGNPRENYRKSKKSQAIERGKLNQLQRPENIYNRYPRKGDEQATINLDNELPGSADTPCTAAPP